MPRLYAKDAGVWKPASKWAKDAGVWKVAEPWARHAGVWKPLTEPLTITKAGQADADANAASGTFSALSIGAAPTGDDRRFIVAAFSWSKGGAVPTLTTLELGGNTMTIIEDVTDFTGTNSCGAVLAILEVPTGTTADFYWECSGNYYSKDVTLYRVISGPDGIDYSDSYQNSGTYNPSFTNVSFVDGSVVLGIQSNRNGGSVSWSGITVDENYDTFTTDFYSTAYDEFEQADTITVQPSATNAADDHASAVVVLQPN